jgi:tripartite-type tricarboxylate transporter receptor subunit TctC
MDPKSNPIVPSLSRRSVMALAAVMLAGAAFPAASQPAPWPSRPIRLVVGFAPGGGTDVMARAIGQLLTEALGKSVIVDNKPGASGNMAVGEVVRAAPDGYTFLIAPTSVETANPFLFKSNLLPSRDLAPVMAIGRAQMYLVARPTLEAKDVKQFIASAKAQPGKLTIASSGTGTAPHLAAELFNQSNGTSITHVPYKGSAPALQDVMAGQADVVFDPGIGFPHIKSGKVKLLAVASERKSSFFPDAPTYAELGIRNASLDIWFGVWAPNKVPADITERFSAALKKVLASPTLRQRFGQLGAEPMAMDQTAFRELLADESKRLSTLIKDRKIVVE